LLVIHENNETLKFRISLLTANK